MNDDRHEQGPASGQWQAAGPAAGWYPDPWDDRRRRYWDGASWTGDVAMEPPGAWAAPTVPGASGHGQPTLQQPAAAGSTQQLPAQQAGAGWGAPAAAPAQWGGGWGSPPQHPGWWGGAQGWQPPAGRAAPGSRIHIGVVVVITLIAVLAGVGIGSQVNSTSSTSAAAGGSTGGGAVTNPFGGGAATGGSRGSTQLTPAQQAVASRVDRSVVDINTQLGFQNGAAAGTGMILTANGTILTNNHVIDGATSISVTVVSTGKSYKADVVGDDVTQDVAVLQMEGASGLTPISIGDSSSVRRGDTVLAIGNALGAGGTPSAVSGVVTNLDQTITASDQNGANAEVLNGLVQTDAPIQAGDSGGPLVNTKGQVIGMDTAASAGNASPGAASQGFAIPIASAQTIATQIVQGKSSDRIHIGQTGFLGVSVAADSGAPGSLGTGNGASVSNVIPGSPADKAGLAGGDTITAVDTTPVTSSTALTKVLRAHHPGDNVAITFSDQAGASHTATVTLTMGPAA